MKRFSFTIRELLLLMVCIGLGLVIWRQHKAIWRLELVADEIAHYTSECNSDSTYFSKRFVISSIPTTFQNFTNEKYVISDIRSGQEWGSDPKLYRAMEKSIDAAIERRRELLSAAGVVENPPQFHE